MRISDWSSDVCSSDLFQSARIFYGKVQKREMDDRTLNTVCEQLLFAFHQLAALRALSAVSSKADVARMAIITWYYGIYGAASAMVAAADGSDRKSTRLNSSH